MARRTSTKTKVKRTASRKGRGKAASAKRKTKKPVAEKKPAAKKPKAPSTTTAKCRSTTSTSARSPKTRTAGKGTSNRVAARSAVRPTTTSKKTSRPAPATSQDSARFEEEPRPLPRTHLRDDELQQFAKLLLCKRAELAGDVQQLTDQALDAKGQGLPEHSTMPIHMADLGSDNWEKEFTLGLIASERALVREIDEALERIENKSYGVCLATGKRISKARLRAKPWAKYCIEYARAREEGRAS